MTAVPMMVPTMMASLSTIATCQKHQQHNNAIRNTYNDGARANKNGSTNNGTSASL